MLLIVKNHEHSQDQQAAQNAADPLPYRMNIPNGAGQRDQDQKRGGGNAPPTFSGVVFCVSLGSDNQFLTGSHRNFFSPYRFALNFLG